MGNIINTKIDGSVNFKIVDSMIYDSFIADWSGVHIYGNSELKKSDYSWRC